MIGVEGGSRRVGIEVLTKRVGSDCSVVGLKEVVKIDAKSVQSLIRPLA